MRPVRLLPSLLACDFTRLAEQLAFARDCGARALHVDVMDGHFVPNLTWGPPLVAAMRRCSDLELDVHLMVSNPLAHLSAYREAGADQISIHVEAVGPRDIERAVDQLHATGARAGLAFNPDTDPMLWKRPLARVDFAMVMTVFPGFGGQDFISATRPRIRALREAFPRLAIQVDGGINRHSIPDVVSDGADQLVAGSAFFGDPDPARFLAWAEHHQASGCP